MRKALVPFVIVLLVSTAAAFAGGSGESSAASGKPVEITWWFPLGGDPDKPALEKAAADFTAANPQIKVKAEFVDGSGINQKLQAAINAGNPPDVVEFDRFQVCQWADQGMLTKLDDLMAKGNVKKDAFFNGPMNEAMMNGSVYALPFDMDTRALFWNKKLFKDAGLDPQTPPKTIAELDAYAEKLTKKDGERITQAGFIPWYGQGSLYVYGWAFGGQFVDASGKVTANQAPIVKALAWMVSYGTKYNAERLDGIKASGAGDIDPFKTGLLAMMVEGYWRINDLKDAEGLDYGTTYIPTLTGENHVSMTGGFSMVLPKGAKSKDAAFAFAAYMTTGQGGLTYAEPTKSYLSNKALNAKLQWVTTTPGAAFFTSLLPISLCRPVITKGQMLSDELDLALNLAVYKGQDPQKVLDDLATKVNAELGKK